MSYIQFLQVNKSFKGQHVLKDTHLQIEKGEFVTLLGPSGCGKSTLLRCLAGLETVSAGNIILDGEDITHKNIKDRNIGMVFQQYSLFPNLTVFENIAFGLKMKKMPKEKIQSRVYEVIRMVELLGKEHHYPSQLSGGQQQRVALARSVVMEPKVLLLDEPLSAIDAKLRKSLQSRIKEIHKELGLTTIFVTHDQDEAMILSDQIHLFYEGRIEQSGSPTQMYTDPKSVFAASFIGHYNIIDGADFSFLTQEAEICREAVAIRPETIQISFERPTNLDGCYCFPATVVDSIVHGNVLRYTLLVKGKTLQADVLFRSFAVFEKGSTVYLTIEKRNCLPLRAS